MCIIVLALVYVHVHIILIYTCTCTVIMCVTYMCIVRISQEVEVTLPVKGKKGRLPAVKKARITPVAPHSTMTVLPPTASTPSPLVSSQTVGSTTPAQLPGTQQPLFKVRRRPLSLSLSLSLSQLLPFIYHCCTGSSRSKASS